MGLTKYQLAKGAQYAKRTIDNVCEYVKPVYTTRIIASQYYIKRITYRDGEIDCIKLNLGKFDPQRYENHIDEWIDETFMGHIYLDPLNLRYRLIVCSGGDVWYKSDGHGNFDVAKSDLYRWCKQHRLPNIPINQDTFKYNETHPPSNLLVPNYEAAIYQNIQSKYENNRIKSSFLSENCIKKSNEIKEFIDFEKMFRSTCSIEIQNAKDVIPIPPYQSTKKNDALNVIFGF